MNIFRKQNLYSRYMTTKQQVMPLMDPLHIIGGGSIGLLFASSIRAAFPSYPLSVLLRDHHKSRIDEDTNEIMVCLLKQGRPRMVPVPARLISDKNARRPIQNLIVSTKAYTAATAVQSVLHRFDPQTPSNIIVLCNGAFAVKEELSQLLSSTNVHKNVKIVLATTTHGAYQEASGGNITNRDDGFDMYRVIHAGEGLTFVQNHPSLSQLWDQAGLFSKSISEQDMHVMLWQKLAANCTINPLTAIHRCENGQLLSPELTTGSNNNHLPSLQDILLEVSSVATATEDAASNDNATDKSLQLLQYDPLRSFVEKVIKDTFHNKSSMLQDVTKKQNTEIDYLNGFVVKMGKQLGIDTPANSEMCRRIHDLSSSKPC